MKKFICSFLVFVMGVVCINFNIIPASKNNAESFREETQDIELEDKQDTEFIKTAVKKATRSEITANENLFGNYDIIDEYTTDSLFVVTFDCNGGAFDGDAYFQQTVESGSLLLEPDSSKLYRYNSKFIGWYTINDKRWNFNNDLVNEDTILKAKWEWDNSIRMEKVGSISQYFLAKYPASSNWNCVTKKQTPYKPVEVQSANFPESDIQAAIAKSGVESSYGGCGPIAMMGIMDYFARYLGYTSIMNDPTNSSDRISLAYQILLNTPTMEWFSTYSGGDKTTITFPSNYIKGFKTLMENIYHLDEQIVPDETGNIFTSKSTKINKIIQSIDNGIPATVYVSGGGDGDFGDHYVNVYNYEIWEGLDSYGNTIRQTIFNTRVNWGRDYDYHMDSDVLSTSFSGVIYYTVKYDNQLIRPSDFAKDFVNGSGQGQYFFYEKTADITTANGFKFGTTRLRCGYIEDQYLVLSANREGAGLAYLEMNFDIDIRAINFDIARWSSKEGIISYVKLLYKDENGAWQEQYDFSPTSITTAKDYFDNYYMSFPVPTKSIKFEVYCIAPTGDTNKGRIVLGDMNLFY